MFKAILFLIAPVIAVQAFARGGGEEAAGPTDSYTLSAGSCSSQGTWTAAALSHTAMIKQAIQQLKDVPECKALHASVNAGLDNMQKEIETINEAQKGSESDRLTKLPDEMMSLRNFVRGDSPFKNQAIHMLLGKKFEEQKILIGLNSTSSQVADGIKGFGTRVRNATSAGLNYYNDVISSLQQANAACLDKDSSMRGVIASGLVQTLSAFSGAGQDGLALKISKAINSTFQYFGRDQKYIESIRMLNDRQFITSMSCLLESTSEGYCNVVDGIHIFQEIVSNHSIKVANVKNIKTGKEEKMIVGVSQNFKNDTPKGPLAGYFILTNQLKIINDWIQKLQYGNTPQLPTEATFQSNVIQNVQNLIVQIKSIEGNFNMQLTRMRDQGMNHQQKQTHLKNMILETAGMITGRTGSGMKENFFMQLGTESEIIYRGLLGIEVPDEVMNGRADRQMFLNNPTGYLDQRYRFISEFANPDAFANQIKMNLEVMMKEARVLADAYYSKFFIVDKDQIVADSLLGMTSSVREALSHVDLYLKDLRERIVKRNKDLSAIGIIDGTRYAITRVLLRYKAIREHGQKIVKAGVYDPTGKSAEEIATDLDKTNSELRRLGMNLLQEVYGQFEVMLARAGWLQNRMTTLVMLDYTYSLRERNSFSPYINDLMLSSGYSALQNLFQTSEISFSRSKTDLSTALNIFTENIRALENISTDVFQRHIRKLRNDDRATPMTTNDRLNQASEDQWENDYASLPGEETSSTWRWVRAAVNNALLSVGIGASKYDKPGLAEQWGWGVDMVSGKTTYHTRPGNEFRTALNERALLCTQTLAFVNIRDFWAQCYHSVLESPLKKETQDPEIKKILHTYLSVPYVRKAYEGINLTKEQQAEEDNALKGLSSAEVTRELKERKDDRLRRNMTLRVCALRDYHRRNEVAKVSAAMKEDQDGIYENELMEAVGKSLDVIKSTVSDKDKPTAQEIDKLQTSFSAPGELRKHIGRPAQDNADEAEIPQ